MEGIHQTKRKDCIWEEWKCQGWFSRIKMFILLEKVFKQDWWRIINQFRNTFKFSDNDSNKEPLKGIDMLLMVEKDVRGRIYHSVIRYVKSNKKYIKTKD